MSRQSALSVDTVDRTPPNYGLIVVFTTAHGAAYRCLACGAGTGVGAYDLPKTRVAARIHREESCPFRDAHHVTKTVMAWQSLGFTVAARRRRPSADCVTYPVASCTCEWKACGEDGDRESARRLARAHRNERHTAWLDRAKQDTRVRSGGVR